MRSNDLSLTILTGIGFIILALAVSDITNDNAPDKDDRYLPPIHIPVHEVCADVVMRAPGGLSHHTGLICYNQEIGWIEMNVQYLSDSTYNQIVQPKKDSLRNVAQQKGMHDAGHDLNWYIRGGI